MSKSRIFLTYLLICLAGGLLYCSLELAFRRRTHWTMLVVGGLCVLALYIVSVKSRVPLWKKCLVAGAVITTVEFITGAIVNIILDWRVWDYSGMRLNLMGQICLTFSFIWVLLSIPAMRLLKTVDERVISKGGRRYDEVDGY